MEQIVIVGGGLAGHTVAREFRKLDRDAELVMLCADAGDFYSKPMLSNALATGRSPEALVTAPAGKVAADLGMTLLPGSRVTAIDRARRVVVAEIDGRVVEQPYSRLVLAIGADPIRLPIEGSGAEAVLSVNDLLDYARFRASLPAGGRVAILGAGLIGCEFANDLAGAGYRVTVFDVAAQPLGRLLPAESASFLKGRLGAAGIEWRLGESVARIESESSCLKLMPNGDGPSCEVDVVLSAVGLRPRISLAEQAGLEVSRGIVADRELRTSDPAIFAIGDCAEVCGLNLPFVMPIMQAARALAATLAGNATPVIYPAMPVVVKTPACPTAVAPPAPAAAGAWQIEANEEGVRALYRGTDGKLLGFALCGASAAERQALAKELPSMLA